MVLCWFVLILIIMKIFFCLIFIFSIKMNSQTLNYLIFGKGGDLFNQRCGGGVCVLGPSNGILIFFQQ